MIGLAVTATVPAIAAAGAAWPLLALVILLVGAVLDGVDGAIAVRTGTASRWGRVLDPFADRCSDLLLLLTLVILGAPAWLGVALALLTLLLESVRAHAQTAGMEGPGALTWWERPSRVIVVSFAAASSGIEWCARQSGITVLPWLDGAALVTVYAVIAAVLAVGGLGHLLVAVYAQLRDPAK
jgi:CDP-diacylglycerol--glycerol-3-phosphate 3-phosphatidyltransferase